LLKRRYLLLGVIVPVVLAVANLALTINDGPDWVESGAILLGTSMAALGWIIWSNRDAR
jgi:hypothetical protein